jgi:hypothetical protein
MAMVAQAVPKIKRFLKPLALRERAQAMVVRLLAAFILHMARMSAVQAAGAIKTDPCHRAQVCRSLGRKFWDKYRPLDTLRVLLLAMESQRRGRFVFILDQTHSSQQGQKTENTFSTGYHPRHPRKKRRYKKYKYARKSGHCFVVGLLITPSGYRIPFFKPFYTKAYCQQTHRAFRKQTELAADLIRELPVAEGAEVVVLGDTAFDAEAIQAACQQREFSCITPANTERVLAGPKPRPKVSSLVSRFKPGQFQTIRLFAGRGEGAVYRRVSPHRIGPKVKPRTYYVHQERREVHSVGMVQLVFSTRKSPRETSRVEVEKILMTRDLKLSTRTIVELYNVRWQIELFFKEMKSTLGLCHYRFRQFARVERWVEMALVTFLYLEWYRANELARRDLSEKEKQWWQRQRTHGLCQAVRQEMERADLQYLAGGLKTPGGIRRLKQQLKKALPIEYRSPV